MTVFITSDWHLGHKSIIDHCYRPFSSIQEMDDLIIRNYCEDVRADDKVFLIGDFAWKAYFFHEILPNLPGEITFIMGNHDEKMYKVIKRHVHSVRHLVITKIDGYRVTLCHYPLESWYNRGHHAYHLHGHLHCATHHGKIAQLPRRFDIGVDCWNYRPVTFKQILEKQANLENRRLLALDSKVL